MNYQDTNKATEIATTKAKQRSIFTNNWEIACKELATLAIPKDDLLSAVGDADEESFLAKSSLLPKLIDKTNLDDLSIAELIFLSQAAKAIEQGDSKAATFVRDTSGGKPTEKTINANAGDVTKLTDSQLDYLLQHCEVVEDDE